MNSDYSMGVKTMRMVTMESGRSRILRRTRRPSDTQMGRETAIMF